MTRDYKGENGPRPLLGPRDEDLHQNDRYTSRAPGQHIETITRFLRVVDCLGGDVITRLTYTYRVKTDPAPS